MVKRQFILIYKDRLTVIYNSIYSRSEYLSKHPVLLTVALFASIAGVGIVGLIVPLFHKENVRQKLAQEGLSWTDASFISVYAQMDKPDLILYLDGGWKLRNWQFINDVVTRPEADVLAHVTEKNLDVEKSCPAPSLEGGEFFSNTQANEPTAASTVATNATSCSRSLSPSPTPSPSRAIARPVNASAGARSAASRCGWACSRRGCRGALRSRRKGRSYRRDTRFMTGGACAMVWPTRFA